MGSSKDVRKGKVSVRVGIGSSDKATMTSIGHQVKEAAYQLGADPSIETRRKRVVVSFDYAPVVEKTLSQLRENAGSYGLDFDVTYGDDKVPEVSGADTKVEDLTTRLQISDGERRSALKLAGEMEKRTARWRDAAHKLRDKLREYESGEQCGRDAPGEPVPGDVEDIEYNFPMFGEEDELIDMCHSLADYLTEQGVSVPEDYRELFSAPKRYTQERAARRLAIMTVIAAEDDGYLQRMDIIDRVEKTSPYFGPFPRGTSSTLVDTDLKDMLSLGLLERPEKGLYEISNNMFLEAAG